MKLNLFRIVSLCLLSLILGCGDEGDEPAIDVVKTPTESPRDEAGVPDEDNIAVPDPVEEHVKEPEIVVPEVNPIQEAIVDVLERLREGYEKEDIDLYLSAFWIDGFQYIADMTTPHDIFDDVIFDEFKQEAQSAARVFARFQDIGLQILTPAQIVSKVPDQIEAMTHYRVQAFANDGHALDGGFLAWYAEGDARFTFEFREGEWRITKWFDEALGVQAIHVFNLGIKPEPVINHIGKLVSIWGVIKTAF